MLKYHIQTIEVGASGATNITFNNIPQNYDDLLLVMSLDGNRTPQVGDNISMAFNGSTAGFTSRYLYGSGTSSGAATDAANTLVGAISGAVTANTFSNASLFIPNYALSDNKGWSLDAIVENNSTEAYQVIQSGVWSNASAINSIALIPQFGSLITQYSSASLYGIKHGTSGEVNQNLATGGEITTSGSYTIHTFNSSGTFTPSTDVEVEYVIVAGGGGGSQADGYTDARSAGGGGAGGYRSSVSGESSGGGASAESALTLTGGQAYSVIVGAGGVRGNDFQESGGSTYAANGSDSSFAGITSLGGGGSIYSPEQGRDGGSGGGSWAGSGTQGNGTAGQGYDGGYGAYTSSVRCTGGGGGGAGQAGANGSYSYGGDGGDGVQSSINGTATYRAGGGGGGSSGASGGGTGGLGGGGNGNHNSGDGYSGTANTGGGGGGAGGYFAPYSGGNGGSGVVIIRYLTP